MKISPNNYNLDGFYQKLKDMGCSVVQGSLIGTFGSVAVGVTLLMNEPEESNESIADFAIYGALAGGISAGTKVIVSLLLKKACRIDISDPKLSFAAFYCFSVGLVLAKAIGDSGDAFKYGTIGGGVLALV